MDNDSTYYSPAEWVVKQFGGVRRAAVALGVQPSSISKWKKPKTNGTAGLIPNTMQRPILDAAGERQIDITSEDVIIGRWVREYGE